jgi:hypothetical protein
VKGKLSAFELAKNWDKVLFQYSNILSFAVHLINNYIMMHILSKIINTKKAEIRIAPELKMFRRHKIRKEKTK